MSNDLILDIQRFFSVYENRTEALRTALPPRKKEELDEEFDLLKVSILNLLSEPRP